uniref:Esophageal gland-localized secretory protein 6 n=1 Tax=Heterodera glycines TaxID=51029 RepID=A0A0E3JCL5_HETGL|nr:esophageal gland-localized secretory protein 6 [Heterodera glycines]
MFSLMLSIFPIVFLVCCKAMPNFPCCPGSQQVVAVMSNYIGTFTSEDKSTVCSTAKNTVEGIKSELSSRVGCPSGGEAQIVNEIDRQLTNIAKMKINYEDECPYNLGFARAMFDLAAAAAGHAGNGTEWQTMKGQFEQESQAIKAIGQEMNIEVTDVHIGHPSKGFSAHQNVPSPSHVIANPGQQSSVDHGKEDTPLSSDFDF